MVQFRMEKHMKNTIINISESFINEAKSSPKMFEDLAAMEKYMSENYDGRTFAELIQNADDALATTIVVLTLNNTIIVANNGRPFNEDDIMAICRSGSSNKNRGSSIGYRGVGFKSATSISSEIVIYSSDTYFTFSKKICASELQKDVNKVPTIRIPFLYNEEAIHDKLKSKIESLKNKGFTTFFIFMNANRNKFIHELDGFTCSWMLFLRNVNKIVFELPEINKTFTTSKMIIDDTESIITDQNNNQQWYIVNNNNVALAFKYDTTGIVPCNVKDAVFHCFLPTIDKTGFLFVVNGDFSTDPSRKHIIIDELTINELNSIQRLFSDFILKAFRTRNQKLFSAISLIITPISLSEISSKLESMISSSIRNIEWIPLNNGQFKSVENISILSQKLSYDEQRALVEASSEIAENVPKVDLLAKDYKFDKLVVKLGVKEISSSIIINAMKDLNTVNCLSHSLLGKLFANNCHDHLRNKQFLSDVLVPLADCSFTSIERLSNVSIVSNAYMNELKLLKDSDKLLLSELFPVFTSIIKIQTTVKPKIEAVVHKKESISPISKWKTPIQNCIAIETLKGRFAKDVSKTSKDYQVMSTSPTGETAYISVKCIGVLGDSFRLSEGEYATAQKYGEQYKVYLFTTDASNIKHTVLSDPCNSLKPQKIVKEWEYIFDSYEYKDDVITDTNTEFEIVRENSSILNKDFDQMDGESFEIFCAQLLLKNGYEDVSLTKTSGDQGIDIIAYKDNIKYALQCKCYSSDIGNSAVQEAYAGKKFYKCNIGIVLTNSHFTSSAIELAESNGVILWGREELLRLIKKADIN